MTLRRPPVEWYQSITMSLPHGSESSTNRSREWGYSYVIFYTIKARSPRTLPPSRKVCLSTR